MNTMVPTDPTLLHHSRIPLTTGPAAAGEARRQVRAAIGAWDVPVDIDTAILLTSELVTNALRSDSGPIIVLAITCSAGQLRVDVHDTARGRPRPAQPSDNAETGRGLMLVDSLASAWGCYPTVGGKAVYFALDFPEQPVPADPSPAVAAGHRPRRRKTWPILSYQAR